MSSQLPSLVDPGHSVHPENCEPPSGSGLRYARWVRNPSSTYSTHWLFAGSGQEVTCGFRALSITTTSIVPLPLPLLKMTDGHGPAQRALGETVELPSSGAIAADAPGARTSPETTTEARKRSRARRDPTASEYHRFRGIEPVANPHLRRVYER